MVCLPSPAPKSFFPSRRTTEFSAFNTNVNLDTCC